MFRTSLIGCSLVLACAISLQAGDLPVQDDTIEDYYKVEKKKPKDQQSHPHLVFAAMKVGDMGMLPYAFDPAAPKPFIKTSVASIIDERTMLLQCDIFAIVQRLQGNRVGPAVPELDRKVYLLVKGVKTAGEADGNFLRLPWGLRVVGTEKVDTPEGKKTVYVVNIHNLRTLDIDKD